MVYIRVLSRRKRASRTHRLSEAMMRRGPASRLSSTFAHICVTAALFVASSAALAQSSTIGPVYSSANTAAQSLIGIFNGISDTNWLNSGQTVTLTLRDGSTGAEVGQWVSPSLRAGRETISDHRDREGLVARRHKARHLQHHRERCAQRHGRAARGRARGRP